MSKTKTLAEWMCEWMCPVNIDDTVLDLANYMIDHKCSVRQVAKNFDMPKSTVHDYLAKRLKYIDDDLYVQCKHLMNEHSKHRKRDERGRFV